MVLNRIKIVLVEKKLSQKWLSEKLGKHYTIVNSYCQNRKQPSLVTLQKIADILHVDIKDLIV